MKLAFMIVAGFFVLTARCFVVHEQQEQLAQTSSNSPLKFVAVDEVANELKRSKRCACGPHGCTCKRSINNENEQTGEVSSILDIPDIPDIVGVSNEQQRSKRCACGPHGCTCKRSINNEQEQTAEVASGLLDQVKGSQFVGVDEVADELKRSKRCDCDPDFDRSCRSRCWPNK